jgi:hypothetical protein
MIPGCSSSATSIALVIQLQRELDLPWIVWSKSSGSDLTEGRVGEVAGASDGGDAVAAEVRRVEVGMVEDVEELSPELHRNAIADLEALEG